MRDSEQDHICHLHTTLSSFQKMHGAEVQKNRSRQQEATCQEKSNNQIVTALTPAKNYHYPGIFLTLR